MVNVCRQVISALKSYFQQLNLFRPTLNSGENENEQQDHFNILVTRVYLVLLVLLLICFASFTTFRLKRTIIELQNPTEEQFNALPADANCPCSQISLYYGEFVSLQANLHEICRSEFVSERWIKAIFSYSNSTYFNFKDFRTFGSAQFQALSGFCDLSRSHLQQNIDFFKRTMLVSTQVLSKINFQQEIESTIARFKQTVSRSFAAQFKFMRQIITNNRLISGLQTNFYLTFDAIYPPAIYAVMYKRADNTSCNCLVDSECTSNAVIDSIFGAQTQYESGNIKIIPGLASGCLPVNSILASTLECFYNQTCLNELISFFPTNEKFSAMIVNNQSRFNPFTVLRSIVDDLMVEDWITNASYTKFFNACASLSCTYVKEKRQTWQFVLTQLISVLATLTMALRILVPIVVKFIMDKINQVVYPEIPIRIRLEELLKTTKKSIIELNLFKDSSCNDRQSRYSRYATRLYIILIIASLSILTLYNVTIQIVHHRTISNPSEHPYLNLDQLTCPCTSLSIPYSSFLTIQAQYHPICSSYLTTSQWIEFVRPKDLDQLVSFDYDYNAATYFQILAMFCEQVKVMVDNTLDDFLQTQIVGSHLMHRELFEKQMIQLIRNWRESTANQFKRSINITQQTISINQAMNRLNIYYQYLSPSKKQVITEPRHYDNCNCAYAECYTPMKIIHHRNDSDFFFIPNFFVGCYPVDALLKSTLECFYNESCNRKVHSYFTSSSSGAWTFPALHSRSNSAGQSIQSIVNQLMVDSWSEDINFTSYYNSCAPNSCTIEYTGRYHILTIITTVSGLFSGLSFGFQKIIWFGLRIIDEFFKAISFRAFLRYIRTLFNRSDVEQITNRLHVILVILALYSLYMHHVFRSDLTIVDTKKPKLDFYRQLFAEHAGSLHCHCSEISIQYRSFLSITPDFYSACSRNIADEFWAIISSISLVDYIEIYTQKYGYVGSGQLAALDKFCKLSKEIVEEALNQLLTSHFVNNRLLPEYLLTQRIQSTISDVQIGVSKTFVNTYALSRLAVTANQLMNTYGTSWVFAEHPKVGYLSTLHTVPVIVHGCNCGLNPKKCIDELFKLKFGCYTIEAMLQSTIQCLYEKSCLDKTNRTKPLEILYNQGRFSLNTTFETLLNELMLEKLVSNLSYENYFENCSPSLCTHSIQNANNLIEGITIVIALYGGVVIICHSIAVILVKLLPRRPTAITPTTD
ncbi:unnamed protein product [Adineta ricciae]|uniref:Uncharacterized protein n=1 Tax=Adineta ricciae TaxID=249248 RepID=A0A815B400_ADIRI|nr:unnamed protein product [Adineta ricciae]CAF1265338.1 unnamed protein product [Adineta ricciae]